MSKVNDMVRDRILQELDKGVIPWHKPWHVSEHDWPHNAISGRRYSGMNALWLGIQPYEDSRWITKKNILARGGTWRGKATFVVFWKHLAYKHTRGDGEVEEKTIPFLRYYNVWNVEQCEGLNLPERPKPVAPKRINKKGKAAQAWTSMPDKPTIDSNGGDRAFYSGTLDRISLPKESSFETAEGYYETLYHELGHSTGHEKRIGRPGIMEFDHFGSGNYGREELIAEFTSAFLMHKAGLLKSASTQNVAAYIASWKRTIKADTNMLVVAAGKAQKAYDYIQGEEA